MGFPSKLMLLATGYGIAKFSESKIMKEVVELTKLGSDQLVHDLKTEANLVKDELKSLKEKLLKNKKERETEKAS